MDLEQACRITGVTNPVHLIASHCKPWRDCSNDERLNGESGLPRKEISAMEVGAFLVNAGGDPGLRQLEGALESLSGNLDSRAAS
jgi:hypothetical protein